MHFTQQNTVVKAVVGRRTFHTEEWHAKVWRGGNGWTPTSSFMLSSPLCPSIQPPLIKPWPSSDACALSCSAECCLENTPPQRPCMNLTKVVLGDDRPTVFTQKSWIRYNCGFSFLKLFSTGTLTSDPYDFANSWALSSGEQRCKRASPPSSLCNVSSEEMEKVGTAQAGYGLDGAGLLESRGRRTSGLRSSA